MRDVTIAVDKDNRLVFVGINIDEEARKDNRKDAAKLFVQGYDVKTIPAAELANYKWLGVDE